MLCGKFSGLSKQPVGVSVMWPPWWTIPRIKSKSVGGESRNVIFGPDHHTHVLHEDDITDKYVQDTNTLMYSEQNTNMSCVVLKQPCTVKV